MIAAADRKRIEAAEGFLELGLPTEANEELESTAQRTAAATVNIVGSVTFTATPNFLVGCLNSHTTTNGNRRRRG